MIAYKTSANAIHIIREIKGTIVAKQFWPHKKRRSDLPFLPHNIRKITRITETANCRFKLSIQENAGRFEIAMKNSATVKECHSRNNAEDDFRLLGRGQHWLSALSLTLESSLESLIRAKIQSQFQGKPQVKVPNRNQSTEGVRDVSMRQGIPVPEVPAFDHDRGQF
jgi:hypothetical protein